MGNREDSGSSPEISTSLCQMWQVGRVKRGSVCISSDERAGANYMVSRDLLSPGVSDGLPAKG